MLTFDERTVANDAGEKRQAIFARCECGTEHFLLFQILGQKHFHLQCAQCEESFCPFGACEDNHVQEAIVEEPGKAS